MANITKRGNSYRIKAFGGYDRNGHQIVKTMTWKPEKNMTARQAEKEVYRQAVLFEERIKNEPEEIVKTRFKDLAEEWLELVSATKELKISTIERLKGCTERTYKVFGNCNVDEITYQQIQRFIVSLSKDGVNQHTGGGLSSKTQLHYLNLISDVMGYAIKCGLIKDNPCKNVKVVKTEKREREVYTLEEEIALLDRLKSKAPIEYVTMFMIYIYLGLRRGEVMGLEWKDIDFENSVCSIVRTSQYRNKNTGVYTSTPKTKSSLRSLKMPDELVKQLKCYKADQDKRKKACGDQWQETDRLFTRWNGEPLYPSQPFKWLERFCKAENLPFKGLHSFRHSFATNAITSGNIDIKTVSAILGNSMPSTTLSIYTHEVAQANAKAMNVVADLFKTNKGA